MAELPVVACLKPYPEYKASGLPWLGKVPKHWAFERAKWIFRHRKELNVNGAQTNVLSLTLRGVVNNNPDDPEGLVPKDYRTYQVVSRDDLIFKLIDLENLRTSRVGLVHQDGIMSSAYVRLTPLVPVNIRYFHYQFYDLYSRGVYNQLGAGVRSTLGPSDLLNIGIVAPPRDEQSEIVSFLDWATGRLDRAIGAKRKVIALLNEQKQVIIHRAVTRGLDPAAPLKPSGIPRLGDIPQHWDTPLNQRIFREEIRPHNGAREVQLSLSQRDGLIATTDMKERSLKTASYENWKVTLPGDLVLNRFKAHLGVFFAAALRGMVSFHYGVFVPRRLLHTKYFELLFHTNPYRAIYAGQSNGMTVGLQNLSNQNFYNVRAVLPPFDEQIAIADFAARETQAIQTAISKLEREIELLREYRTSLVADVVTGKLDVREAAVRLLDSVEAFDTVQGGPGSGEEEESDEEIA